MLNEGTYTNTFSKFYDLVYSGKNYLAEASYIINKIQGFHSDIQSVLELGCGTGNYSRYFVGEGWELTTLDKSFEMLKILESKKIPGLQIIQNDLLDFKAPNQYDIILSLFNVIGYVIHPEEIELCFKNISINLKNKGLFYFDVWNADGVHYHQFLTKVKRVENEHYQITRISESDFIDKKNQVKVDFEFFILDKLGGHIERVRETHYIHPYSVQEVQDLARKNGLTILYCEESFTGKPLNSQSWMASYILKKP